MYCILLECALYCELYTTVMYALYYITVYYCILLYCILLYYIYTTVLYTTVYYCILLYCVLYTAVLSSNYVLCMSSGPGTVYCILLYNVRTAFLFQAITSFSRTIAASPFSFSEGISRPSPSPPNLHISAFVYLCCTIKNPF